MCYVDKPETIDILKHNIREAIGEIQLHTIDVLKNWTDHIGCVDRVGLATSELRFDTVGLLFVGYRQR